MLEIECHQQVLSQVKLDRNVVLAFLGLLCIWSTTPIAIQWSNLDNGHLFAVMARMAIGGLISLVLLFAVGGKLPLHRLACFTYIAAGLGIYIAMTLVYKAAADVPSGWIAVMFSLNPLATAMLAHVLVPSERLKMWHVAGLIFGMIGVWLIFQDSLQFSNSVTLGLGLISISVFAHSLSGVLIRRFASGVSPLAINAGSHLIAVPLFIVNWLWFDGNLALQFSWRGGVSLLYLGVAGSTIGFLFYYYLIQRVGPSKTAIVLLITPVIGIFIGIVFNNESASSQLWLGTLFLIIGVGLNIWHSRNMNKRKPLTG